MTRCAVLSFDWLYNGTLVHPSLNPGLTVLTDGALQLATVRQHHGGLYICRVLLQTKLKTFYNVKIFLSVANNSNSGKNCFLCARCGLPGTR